MGHHSNDGFHDAVLFLFRKKKIDSHRLSAQLLFVSMLCVYIYISEQDSPCKKLWWSIKLLCFYNAQYTLFVPGEEGNSKMIPAGIYTIV